MVLLRVIVSNSLSVVLFKFRLVLLSGSSCGDRDCSHATFATTFNFMTSKFIATVTHFATYGRGGYGLGSLLRE